MLKKIHTETLPAAQVLDYRGTLPVLPLVSKTALAIHTSARKVPIPNLLTQSCLASRFNAAMTRRMALVPESAYQNGRAQFSTGANGQRRPWRLPFPAALASALLKPTSAVAPSAGQDDLRERAILSDCLPLGAYSIQTCLNCRLLLHPTPPLNSHPRHTHAHITPRQPTVRTNRLRRFCCSVSTFCSFLVPGATLSFSINYLCSSKAMLIRIFLPPTVITGGIEPFESS